MSFFARLYFVFSFLFSRSTTVEQLVAETKAFVDAEQEKILAIQLTPEMVARLDTILAGGFASLLGSRDAFNEIGAEALTLYDLEPLKIYVYNLRLKMAFLSMEDYYKMSEIIASGIDHLESVNREHVAEILFGYVEKQVMTLPELQTLPEPNFTQTRSVGDA